MGPLMYFKVSYSEQCIPVSLGQFSADEEFPQFFGFSNIRRTLHFSTLHQLEMVLHSTLTPLEKHSDNIHYERRQTSREMAKQRKRTV